MPTSNSNFCPLMTDLSVFSALFMGQPVWMWGSFAAVVLSLLVLDLGIMHRKEHEIRIKESLLLSAFYIVIGLLFGGWIWYELGEVKAAEYFTGYVVEESLSVDNIFVMAMLFSFFKVPRLYQHRVLFWGILGAIVLRGLMIGVGGALVARYEWILDIFALFLVFTGVKMLMSHDKPSEIKDNPILTFLKAHFRVTENFEGHAFFVRRPSRKHGKKVLWLTPLFLCLVMIEVTDILFAVDSVPAIFIITKDPMIVFTSNIFAIMGLRSLYFVLADIINRFHYLKYALSVLLIFIGSKTFIAKYFGWEKFPIDWSLFITFAILGAGVGYSLWKTQQDEKKRLKHRG
ncbi:MAG: TerC family protein [Alphaproteobacteria bacterium]|nr:TerC family protein [Alphaproteobacteria bacterium]